MAVPGEWLRVVSFDARDPGTSRAEWLADPRFALLPRLSTSPFSAILVLAAHPDDETLGAGGTMALAVAAGQDVRVVCVTDGADAADRAGETRGEVARTRERELRDALAALGILRAPEMLGFADGSVREAREDIAGRLRRVLDACPDDTLVLAPWVGDGHRDHRVLGEIAVDVAASRGVALWQYPVWMWHWGSPSHPDVPWQHLAGVAFGERERSLAQDALGRFTTQITSVAGAPPMLHPRFLEHFDRRGDVFVTSAPGVDTLDGHDREPLAGQEARAGACG